MHTCGSVLQNPAPALCALATVSYMQHLYNSLTPDRSCHGRAVAMATFPFGNALFSSDTATPTVFYSCLTVLCMSRHTRALLAIIQSVAFIGGHHLIKV